MSVPPTYQWSDIPYEDLQAMSNDEKRAFLKKEEINIRQNLGEAVPTIIFQQIANKIKTLSLRHIMSNSEIMTIIKDNKLDDVSSILSYIKTHHNLGFVNLSKIAELANSLRSDNAAYYTSQDICYNVVKNLPDVKDGETIHILEPSVGLGNFLPTLFVKYANAKEVYLDVCDIDKNSIDILKELLKTLYVPSNFKISFINDDTLLHIFSKHYDIVVGNPPYMKFNKDKELLNRYRVFATNTNTNNLFSFFIEKAMTIADYVALIVPKSLINAPEFNKTRELMCRCQVSHIIDYGESAFKGVKIETISFVINTKKKPQYTFVESYITNSVVLQEQTYIMDSSFPYWLIYRNENFDNVANKMVLGVFNSYRDRVITKKHTKSSGKYRVLKSRNIGSNCIIDIDGYDSYIDDITMFGVAKYLNKENCFLVPNLTYYPRSCMLPKDCIVDGSVAILTTKSEDISITQEDLSYYATEEFRTFYKIARNLGTRSLNIDNNSVFFFGKLKD
jgi:DNA (cytosine-5)-methyltransferase 1